MSTEVPQIDPNEARTLIDGGALLLDVREPNEWQAGHAAEATFIPLGEVTARTGELPTAQRIVVICRSGARSNRAAQFLQGAGFDVVNVAGGMRAWAESGYGVVTDDGATGTVA